MAIKIGIPRALLFYYYYPLWRTFFETLGAEVVVSGPTTKEVLQEGIRYSVDEACLPVKVAFGHVARLRDRVDYIFMPRLVSVAPREYICPKFLGFPDMARQCIPGLPGVIDTSINLYRSEDDLHRQLGEAIAPLCKNPFKISAAYKKALQEQRRFIRSVEAGALPEQAFLPAGQARQPAGREEAAAVIGHPYNIYDSFINMRLIKRLADSGVRVLTSDNVPEEVVNRYAGTLEKRLFWTLGRRMVGASYYFIDNPGVKGLIHVASFACGPDSMTGDMIERKARHSGDIPFLNLTLDEHTGEAGIVTRIEAFLDMVGMRRTYTDGLFGRNSEARSQNSECV